MQNVRILPPRWSSVTGLERVCLHHVSPGGHLIHTPCAALCSAVLCSAHTSLSSPVSLLMSTAAADDDAADAELMLMLMLLSPTQPHGGSRVAP